MNTFEAIAPLLCGIGLFFIGVRMLSANLVPLVGTRTRAAFSQALRGPVSSAASGLTAGLLTQSSVAVSWIILGLIRAGLPASTWVLVTPAWSNVGAALLPVLVAVNFSASASCVIGAVGFCIYFRVDSTDRRRHLMEAALGAALLLFGMHIVSASVGPVQDTIVSHPQLAAALHMPWLLAGLGAAVSVVTQSSSVAAALTVEGVTNGLFILPAALPLIAGANAAGVLNNLLKMQGENAAGRQVFGLQMVQKAAGSLLLTGLAAAPWMLGGVPAHGSAGRVAIVFTIAQFAGAAAASLLAAPVAALVARLKPAAEAAALGQPVFLLRTALDDPPVALNLAMRELGRLAERFPLLLDGVRGAAQGGSSAVALHGAGLALAEAVKHYLAALLDRHPGRGQVAAALLLENAAGNAGALYTALADFCAAAPDAAGLQAAGQLVESLHLIMGLVADHAAALGDDDPDFLLGMLGDRNKMMAELRQRLAENGEAAPAAQNALFRMSILFERAVWLARRLVTDLSQARQAEQR